VLKVTFRFFLKKIEEGTGDKQIEPGPIRFTSRFEEDRPEVSEETGSLVTGSKKGKLMEGVAGHPA
jgi:hypothetical protein